MVTAEELVRFHEETCIKARKLVTPKGQDYSKSSSRDTLSSIRVPALLGIHNSTTDTALGHIAEKLSRLISTTDIHKPINFESVDETIHDLINYTVYLKWFYHESKTQRLSTPDIQAIESGRIFIGNSEKEEDVKYHHSESNDDRYG